MGDRLGTPRVVDIFFCVSLVENAFLFWYFLFQSLVILLASGVEYCSALADIIYCFLVFSIFPNLEDWDRGPYLVISMTSAYFFKKKNRTWVRQPSASVVGRRGDPRASPIPWQWCRGRLCRSIFYKKNTSCFPSSVRAVETEHRRRWQRSRTEPEPTSGWLVTSGDFEKPGNLERPRVATAMPSFVLQKQSSDRTVPLVLSSIFMESNLSGTGRWTTSFRLCNQLWVHLPGGPVDFEGKLDACACATWRHKDGFSQKWRPFNLVFILRSQHLFYTLLPLVFILRMDSVLND